MAIGEWGQTAPSCEKFEKAPNIPSRRVSAADVPASGAESGLELLQALLEGQDLLP